MALRLEDQLVELKKKQREAAAELVKLTQEHAPKISKAEAAQEEIRVASEQADADASKLEHEIEARNKITRPVKGDRTSWEWHPDFLDRVAKIVGIHFNDRTSVDPKNQRDSLYEQALHRAHSNMLRSHPDVIEARNKVNELYEKLREARTAAWTTKRPLEDADRKVRYAKREIEAMEVKIRERNAEKQRAAALDPQAKKTVAQLDEAAKHARDKLRALMEGTIKLKLEAE